MGSGPTEGAARGVTKEETMTKVKTLKAGLMAAGALLMLSGCASQASVNSLDDRVSALETRTSSLETRANAAESKAAELQAAASQCTTTCQDVQARAERMYQQSLRK
jgi:outer membrane murein-binding lipoprotein Lpp